MLSSFLIAVPTGVKIFNWIGDAVARHDRIQDAADVLRRAASRCSLIGGISGVFLAVFPVDWQLNETYFVVAHLHFVLIGGAVFPIFAGDLLLVPEDHRPDAQRGARQAELLR